MFLLPILSVAFVPQCPPTMPNATFLEAISRSVLKQYDANINEIDPHDATPQDDHYVKVKTTTCQLNSECKLETTTCTTSLSDYVPELIENSEYIGHTSCGERFSPDLGDCRGFYYCLDDVFYKFECRNGTVYDAKLRECTEEAVCRNYSSFCEENVKIGVPLLEDPGKFLYCLKPPVLLECFINSTSLRMYFDSDTQSCQVSCQEEGIFPDPTSNASYFQCFEQDGGEIKAMKKLCSGRTTFDPSYGICRSRELSNFDMCSNSSAINTLCELHEVFQSDDVNVQDFEYGGIKLVCKEERGNYFYKCGEVEEANCLHARLVKETIVPRCEVEACSNFYWLFDCT